MARLLLAATAAIATVAVVIAQRRSPDDISAPADVATAADLPVLAGTAPTVEAAGWINTEPLESSDLHDKVVLYDFWTFGCSNCRDMLPYVQAWHERYAGDGLVLLSIHTPEFDYERDPDAVAEFVEERGLTYPVALDPGKQTWRAFGNHYWPRVYLQDADGRLRYDHIGEGHYDETENAIRALLGVDQNSPRAEIDP